MITQRIIGAVLAVVGVILLIMGITASRSVADRWSNFFTGHFTDITAWYIIGGIGLAVFGVLIVSVRRRIIIA